MERDVFIQPNHLISEEAKMYCNTLRDFVDKPSQFTVCPNMAYDSVLTITTALYVTPAITGSDWNSIWKTDTGVVVGLESA